MFQSRISGAARTAGKECLVDKSVERLVERVTAPDAVTLVLIDLTLRTLDLPLEIPRLHEHFTDCKILAYGPHVDVDRLDQAQESGADFVLTRGQMDRDLASIIQGA
jgi:hypothetical protein